MLALMHKLLKFLKSYDKDALYINSKNINLLYLFLTILFIIIVFFLLIKINIINL